jgi:hypothetical protein
MNDLDLLVAGAMVSFLSVAGAYIAVRHRANDSPVNSYRPQGQGPGSPSAPHVPKNLNPR